MKNFFLILIIIFALFATVLAIAEIIKRLKMTPEERKAYKEEIKASKEKIAYTKESPKSLMDIDFGIINPEIICPHCQKKGSVRIKNVIRKKGISGAKATGALLTGGISLLATGLSRKVGETQAYCERCQSIWFF